MRKIILLSVFLVLGIPNSTLKSEPLRLDNTVDVAQFVLGDTELWPRTGDHQMNQVFDPARKFLFWMKLGNPKTYEVWSWDDEWVYLHEDKGDGQHPYMHSNDRWFKRHMRVGEVIDNTDNYLTEFNAQCQVVKRFPFPYKNTLEYYIPHHYVSPDLGYRDLIVMRSQPEPWAVYQYFERFLFAKGAGWIRWEMWQYGVLQARTTFTALGGADVRPDPQPCRPPRK